jgi:hypothetical protein
MNDGNTGKLVPFRDRAKRPQPRAARRRNEPQRRTAGEGRPPTASERVWLARGLSAVAIYVVIYWIAIATGVLALDAHADLRGWTVSLVLADLAVAALAVLGVLELGRTEESTILFPYLASGGVIAISCARIGRAAAASFARDLAPSERLEIVAVVGCLMIGIWVVSYALRSRLAH